MKESIAVFVFLLTASLAFGQSVDISEAPRTKDGETHNSFLFSLPDVSKKEAEKDWKSFMGDFKGGKTKYDKKKKLYVTDDAKMPDLSRNPVDVYASIVESGGDSKTSTITVWFDMGDRFVDSKDDSEKGTYIHGIMTKYAMTASKNHASSVMKMEEKRLSELEKQMKKLKGDNKDYRSAIEKAKKTIAKNEKKIETNEVDQAKKAKEIEMQKKAVSGAKVNV
ncbi:MAG: hypothetical protein AAFV25_28420, partial [Bacteroidota bacterium]